MRDAVKVCKSLGIRYLWVDALCIIQDSKNDWEQENQQMSRVYEGSYLTISSWNERGWVFQEKSMSTRKLFFGKSMLHVQTNTIVNSENGYGSAIEVNSYDHRTMSDNRRHDPYELWNSVVLRFACLIWTEKTNLFPGLSGPADKFTEVLKDDEYLAGHWKRDLGCT
ncbi:hypothetical protein B0T21DRAFT_338960 [Apiosordaria backusii]|uniref:Heterokaryon incompatibility domain-containing protein n=1 Tax=Apiosordaria backusii TaxID=314023 RepID=A0AA40ANC6_9PEZI|nr:hypothetical protein B0T21DRAFT_338960 [Apiosordaria backusii]